MAKRAKKTSTPITPIGEMLEKLENPAVIQKIIYGLAGFCLLLFLADLLHIRHGKFAIEDLLGFYGFYGFLAFAFIILSTKYLRMVIGRREDYYEPSSVDSEDYPSDELAVKDHSDD